MTTPRHEAFWRSFIILFLSMVLLLSLVIGGVFYADFRSRLEVDTARERDRARLGSTVVTRYLDTIFGDVRFLAGSVSLNAYLDSPSDQTRHKVEREFRNFSCARGYYDQIRYLDNTGREAVRVDYDGGNCSLVALDELQDKGKRYYFTDAVRLSKGEIFVSPLDLNIENGAIERPFKPMIRIGTPVFDSHGSKRGIVLLNYYGAELIGAIEEAMSGTLGYAFMLNTDGYWLLAEHREDAWGFMLNNGRSFSERFPHVWRRMRASGNGQTDSMAGIFSWEKVYPLAADMISSTGSVAAAGRSAAYIRDEQYFWIVGTHVPGTVVSSWASQRLNKALMLMAPLGLLALLASYFVARAWSHERQAMWALMLSEQRQRAITAQLAEGLLVLDDKCRLIMMNPEAERLLGWREATVVGQDMHKRIHSSPASADGDECRVLKPGPDAQVIREEEDQFMTSEGRSIPVAYTASPYVVNDKIIGVIVAFEDITERKRVKEELTRLATFDALTGLLNRREAERSLVKAFDQAKRYGRSLSICLCDIDYFKDINDSRGHPAGDEILKRVGGILQEMTREADFAGRYGGEEFLVGMVETDIDGAFNWAERFRRKIASTRFEVGDGDDYESITVSVGVASYSGASISAEALVDLADKALYRAKEKGRNKVCIAES